MSELIADSRHSSSAAKQTTTSAILHVVNQSGGGTMRYIESLIHADAMPYRSLVWYVGRHQHVLFDVETPFYYAFSAELAIEEQQRLVLSLIADIGVSDLGLHLHSFWGQALALIEQWTACSTVQLPMTATFHDHHFLSETPFIDGQLALDAAHIERVRRLLDNANIIAPSHYLYQHALPYYREEKLHLIAHGSEPPAARLDTETQAFVEKLKRQANWDCDTLTVAAVGAIGEDKGLATMKAWLAIRDEVQFICIGYTGDFAADQNRPQASDKTIIHGFYHHAEVPELLTAYGVDAVIFFPGIAESFCYALSDIAGRVPVLAPSNGALGERVIAEQLGEVYPSDLNVEQLSQRLQEAAKLTIATPKPQTIEAMTLKTAHYYQQQDIESLLQRKFSADEMSALLDEQLHAENLKWELALLVRQHYDLNNQLQSLQKAQEQQDIHPQEVEMLKQQLSHQQQTLDAMQQTLSWKVTRPLRAVRRLLSLI